MSRMMNFYKKVQKPNFLPYKQRVTGSNPVAPTKEKSVTKSGLFHFEQSGFYPGLHKMKKFESAAIRTFLLSPLHVQDHQ